MRDGANAADALGNVVGIGGLAALHDHFHAAEESTGNPRIGDDATLDFALNAEVTLDSGKRVYD
jgi:hypothetical protein